MKKIFSSIIAVLALAFITVTVTSCEMTYSKDYDPLIQWFAPHTGDSGDWCEPRDDNKLTYNASTGLYEITITTGRKNVGISVCQDANYSGQLNWDKADAATQAAFSWKDDYGNKQLVIKNAGDYKITVNNTEKVWTVTAQ